MKEQKIKQLYLTAIYKGDVSCSFSLIYMTVIHIYNLQRFLDFCEYDGSCIFSLISMTVMYLASFPWCLWVWFILHLFSLISMSVIYPATFPWFIWVWCIMKLFLDFYECDVSWSLSLISILWCIQQHVLDF